MKKYLPVNSEKKYRLKKTRSNEYIKRYFCSNHLVQNHAIPIWDPTPIKNAHLLERVRIDVGDVGTITELGGFRVAYNILMDETTNVLCGYSVPPNFSQFIPPIIPGREYSIEINANVVDLDNCGAFAMKPMETSRPFFTGFKHDYQKSAQK